MGQSHSNPSIGKRYKALVDSYTASIRQAISGLSSSSEQMDWRSTLMQAGQSSEYQEALIQLIKNDIKDLGTSTIHKVCSLLVPVQFI